MSYIHVPCWGLVAIPVLQLALDAALPTPIDYAVRIVVIGAIVTYLLWKKRHAHPSMIAYRARRALLDRLDAGLTPPGGADRQAVSVTDE